MAKEDKKKEISALFLALLAFLFFWKKAKPSPPEPEPELATLWGVVTDASTGNTISGIEATLDSLLITTGTDGRYEFANVEPGTYSLIFTDPLGRYEPLTM